MKVNQLGLRGTALQAAQDFERRYPDAVFTSGRRGVADQARAMAQNVASNRQWIAETYKKPLCAAARALQDWVDRTPHANAVSDLTVGFVAILQTFSDDELGKLTCHLSGDAFDAQTDGDLSKDAFLQSLAAKYGGKFLDKEGGLKRRHWQARP